MDWDLDLGDSRPWDPPPLHHSSIRHRDDAAENMWKRGWCEEKNELGERIQTLDAAAVSPWLGGREKDRRLIIWVYGVVDWNRDTQRDGRGAECIDESILRGMLTAGVRYVCNDVCLSFANTHYAILNFCIST